MENRLKEIREQKGLSRKDLMKLSGVSYVSIRVIENGSPYYNPSWEIRDKIAAGLGVPVEEVFDIDRKSPEKGGE